MPKRAIKMSKYASPWGAANKAIQRSRSVENRQRAAELEYSSSAVRCAVQSTPNLSIQEFKDAMASIAGVEDDKLESSVFVFITRPKRMMDLIFNKRELHLIFNVPLGAPPWTVLDEAVAQDDLSIVAWLASHGNAPLDDSGTTALMKAARMGKARSAVLMARTVSADARDAEGQTALMSAAKQGRLKTTIALLPYSDANARDSEGKNALMLALIHGSFECAEALLGATDLSARDARGMSAGDYAKGRRSPLATGLASKIDAMVERADIGLAIAIDRIPSAKDRASIRI